MAADFIRTPFCVLFLLGCIYPCPPPPHVRGMHAFCSSVVAGVACIVHCWSQPVHQLLAGGCVHGHAEKKSPRSVVAESEGLPRRSIVLVPGQRVCACMPFMRAWKYHHWVVVGPQFHLPWLIGELGVRPDFVWFGHLMGAAGDGGHMSFPWAPFHSLDWLLRHNCRERWGFFISHAGEQVAWLAGCLLVPGTPMHPGRSAEAGHTEDSTAW